MNVVMLSVYFYFLEFLVLTEVTGARCPPSHLPRRYWYLPDRRVCGYAMSYAINTETYLRGGGADGSIFTFNETELAFPANDGLDDVLDDLGPFFQKFSHVLTPGDL